MENNFLETTIKVSVKTEHSNHQRQQNRAYDTSGGIKSRGCDGSNVF